MRFAFLLALLLPFCAAAFEHNTWDAEAKEVDARTVRVRDVKNGNDYTQWLPGLHVRQLAPQAARAVSRAG